MKIDVDQAIRQCKAMKQPSTKEGGRAAARLLEEKAGTSVLKLREAQAIRFLAKFLPNE